MLVLCCLMRQTVSFELLSSFSRDGRLLRIMSATQNTDTAIVKRITTILFVTKSLHSTAIVGLLTVTPIIAVNLTGNDMAVGLPATLVLIGRAMAAYPVGWLMDRLGRRLGLNVGFLVAIFGMSLGAIAVVNGLLWLFLTGSFFLGMSRSAVEQMRFIAAEVQPVGRRAQAIGLIAFSSTIGSLAGSLLMDTSPTLTVLLGVPILAVPFIMAIGLMFVGITLNQLFLRPDPLLISRQMEANNKQTDAEKIGRARSMGQIFGQYPVILAASVMAISWLGMTVVMQVTPLFMNYEGYDVPIIARAVMIHSLGMFAFSSGTGWLTSRIGRLPVVALGIVLLIVSGISGCFADTLITLYIAVFLLGVGWNFCYIAGSAMLSDQLRPEERGRAQGVSEAFIGVTAAIGSVTSGLVYANYGYTGSNLIVIGLSVLLFVILAFLGRPSMQTSGAVS